MTPVSQDDFSTCTQTCAQISTSQLSLCGGGLLLSRAGTWLGTNRISRLEHLWLESVDWRLYLRLPAVLCARNIVWKITSRNAKEIAVLFTLVGSIVYPVVTVTLLQPLTYEIDSKWNSPIKVCFTHFRASCEWWQYIFDPFTGLDLVRKSRLEEKVTCPARKPPALGHISVCVCVGGGAFPPPILVEGGVVRKQCKISCGERDPYLWYPPCRHWHVIVVTEPLVNVMCRATV